MLASLLTALRRGHRPLPAAGALARTFAFAFAFAFAASETSAAAGATLAAPLNGGFGCASATVRAECLPAPALNGETAVAVTPGAGQILATGRDTGAVTVIDRDVVGRLTATTCLGSLGCAPARALAGASAIDVSGDGRLVAVAAPAAAGVAVLRRDPATGALTQPPGAAGCATETGSDACLDGRALAGARDVEFSEDGTRLFVAAGTPSHAVTVLRVDPSIGITSQPAGSAGCFSETGLSGLCGNGWSLVSPTSVTAVPGGVLVTASASGSLVRLALNGATGELSQPTAAGGCIRETGTSSCPDGRALAGAADVAVSADGTTALVASAISDAVAVIGLGPTLAQIGCISETGTSGQCVDGRALDGATAIAASPDGRTAYVAASVSDAVAVLELNAAGGVQQAADATGCTSESGDGCAQRSSLDSARAVAVDAEGRPVAAGTGTVVGFRLTRTPECAPVTVQTTWDTPVTAPLDCTDPDGDPLTLRLSGDDARAADADADADVRLEGERVVLRPTEGEARMLRLTVTADDGALRSAPASVILHVQAPPAKGVPPLPGALTQPLLGVERRPLDLAAATTTLPTFCLPRRASSCSGTIELRSGGVALGQTPATGPGHVAIALAPAARQALRATGRAAAVLRAVGPAGPAGLSITLPVRLPRPGRQQTGGRAADRLRGGPGDDRLSGRGSNDRLTGVAGDDRLIGGGGADRLDGGPGQDDLSGSFGNDRLDAGSGDDVLRGASGDDLLRGGHDADRLDGGTGNDRLDGGPGDDVLDGFDGDDILRGGPGDDYLVEARFGDDILLDGGEGDDYVDGNRGNDRLVLGGPGNDIVLGGPGSDRVEGGDGDDVVDGGAGEDPMIGGGAGDDVLVGGRGNDRLDGGPGDDVLYGSTGLDVIDCGPGEDWVHVDSDTEARRTVGCEHIVSSDPTRNGEYDPVALVANRGLARGGANALRRGSALGDVPRTDRPIGTDGNDELRGGPQRDLLTGRDGDDLILGGGGNDDLDGGDGHDELRGGDGRDRLFGRFGDDDIHGEGGDDELEGGRGRDTLDGGSGDDSLNGGFGEDTLRGGPGRDRLIAVGGGADALDCGPGYDRADVDRSDTVRNCEDVRRH